MDIREEVKKIIIKELGVTEEQITDDARFVEDLHADSLEVTTLVMAFEEKFGIEIPDQDMQKLQTVGDAIKYLEERTKK